jgi:hypothetical protein
LPKIDLERLRSEIQATRAVLIRDRGASVAAMQEWMPVSHRLLRCVPGFFAEDWKKA